MDEETKAALRPITARAYGVQVCVMALMATHPDSEAMRAAIAHCKQRPMAILEGLSWPEADLAVFHDTIAVMETLLPG